MEVRNSSGSLVLKSAKEIFLDFSPNKKKVFVVILCISLLLHLISAVSGKGFFHYDEYFQIIEFASWKLGITKSNEMPWELASQIRPSIQPWIFLLIIKIFGAENPFRCIMVSKIISAVFSFSIFWIFLLYCKNFIQNKSVYWIGIIIAGFSGLICFIHSMFTAENISGSLYLLGLIFLFNFLIKKHENDKISYIKMLIFCGFTIGVSIAIRLQTVLFLPGLLIFMVWNKSKLKEILLIAAGGVIAMGLLVLLDSLFYNQLVFTPYNYFYFNIIKSVAAKFGVSPWYEYFLESFRMFGYSIYLFVGAFILCILYQKNNLFLLSFITFVSIHILISHKELRFLFPAFTFFPLILTFALDIIVNKFNNNIFNQKKYFILFTVIIICFSVSNYSKYIFNPRRGDFVIYEYLHNNSPVLKTDFISQKNDFPYNDVLLNDVAKMNKYMPMKFIMPGKKIHGHNFIWWNEYKHYLDSIQMPSYLVYTGTVNSLKDIQDSIGHKIEIVYSTNQNIPSFIKFNGWENRTTIPMFLKIEN